MSKKQSAIVRIVAWSVVAVVLTAMLLLGIKGKLGNISTGRFSISLAQQYRDASKYQAGNASIGGDEVKALEINWLDGTIDVEVYDGDTVEVSETADKSLDESDKLHYYNRDGRLIIQYRKSERKFFSWFGSSDLNKRLLIRIPKATAGALKDLDIDTISSDSVVSGLTAETMTLDSTSGDFELKGCAAGSLEMDSTSGSLKGDLLKVSGGLEADTTSGNADLKGTFGRVDFDTVSGSLTLDAQNCPERIETDTVSGDVNLILPEGEGFSYEMDSVSGGVNCEFPVTQKGSKGIYGDGNADFNFDSVSGDVTLKMQTAGK